MALTKVRLPVADIEAISNGTSDITIGSAGGDIVVTRGGTVIGTYGAGGLTFGTGLTLTVDNIVGEEVDLSTAGGAALSLTTTASQAELETTSAHPLVIGANSIDALTVGTDGKVSLGVVGTLAAQLVDKNYVDTQVASQVSTSDIVFNATSPGSLTIPNSTGNDFIFNWGITASIANTFQSVTFNTAFPNAVLGAFATRIAGPAREDRAGVNNVTTTGMQVVQSGGNSSQVYWMAFGY